MFVLSRCSRWCPRLRSAWGAPTAALPCVANRLSPQPSQPPTTTFRKYLPWLQPRRPAPAYTPTQPLLPSLQLPRPWSSCWAEVTAAMDTPPPPMQQRMPHRPRPGEIQPVARILSVVCYTAYPQPTSTSLPLGHPTSAWRPEPRLTVPTSWAQGAWHSTPTCKGLQHSIWRLMRTHLQ